MPLGLGLGLGLPFAQAPSGPAVYDPSTLSATGWWRTDFSASPWAGTASAGSSGGRSLTGVAGTGTALNGRIPADFNGTNQELANATAISTLLSASAWFAWVLFNARTISTANANPFQNIALLCDSGAFWGIHLHSAPKVQVYQFSGANKVVEIPISLNAWTLVCARFDGTNLRAQVNSTLGTPTASGNISTVTGTLKVGRISSAFYDGRIADIGLSASAESDARFDDIRAYVNSRYSLSL